MASRPGSTILPAHPAGIPRPKRRARDHPMTQTGPDQMLGAEAFLRSMKTNGIDYLFANPGSDFAPIIETYAAAGRTGDIPQEITAPHENVCVATA